MANHDYITRCLESGYLLLPAIISRGQAMQDLQDHRGLMSELGDVQSSLGTACSGLRQVRDYLSHGFELRPIVTGNTVAKIRQIHESQVFTPRNAEEARSVIAENCGQLDVSVRIQDGLKSLLSSYGTMSSRFQSARVSLEKGRLPEAKGTMRDGISALVMSARTPWLKTGQLMLALSVLDADAASGIPQVLRGSSVSTAPFPRDGESQDLLV